jgi:hypothetical protein
MKTLAATFLVTLAFAAPARAQNSAHYRIERTASDAGGITTAAGGPYSLDAVLGEPAPSLSSSANYRLQAGAHPAASTVSACGRLTIALAGGSAVVTWPAELGCVLETTTALGDATNWTTVQPRPAGGTLTVPVASGAWFFRLRSP